MNTDARTQAHKVMADAIDLTIVDDCTPDALATVALAALLAARVPCPTCRGSRIDPADPFDGQPSGMDLSGNLTYYQPTVEDDPCPDCHGDGRGGPLVAALALEA